MKQRENPFALKCSPEELADYLAMVAEAADFYHPPRTHGWTLHVTRGFIRVLSDCSLHGAPRRGFLTGDRAPGIDPLPPPKHDGGEGDDLLVCAQQRTAVPKRRPFYFGGLRRSTILETK